jgi:hypothetical protein
MMLVLLNLLGLIVGLAVLRHWCKSQNPFSSETLAMTFVLSSWVMVKHVTLPLAELPYFGLSSLSLFLSDCSIGKKDIASGDGWLFQRSLDIWRFSSEKPHGCFRFSIVLGWSHGWS